MTSQVYHFVSNISHDSGVFTFYAFYIFTPNINSRLITLDPWLTLVELKA